MIELVRVDLKANKWRIGTVIIKYWGLLLCCDICVYKEEKLWIRMPESWIQKKVKKRYVWWGTPEESNEFQVLILKKVFDMVGLDLQKAVEIKKNFFTAEKEMTNKHKEITLIKKIPEVKTPEI